MVAAEHPIRDTIDQGRLETLIAGRLAQVNPAPYRQGRVDDVLAESSFSLTPHAESSTLSHLAFTVDVIDGQNTGRRSQQTSIELVSEVQVTLCYHTRTGDEDGILDKRLSLRLCADVVAAITYRQEPTWPPGSIISILPDRVGRLVTLSDPSFILRVCTFAVRHDLPLIAL
jgi:hypothetical protein